MFLSEQYLTISGIRLQSIYMRVSLFGLFARSIMPCKADSSVLISVGLYYMVLQFLTFIGLLYVVKLSSISLNVKVIEQAWLEILHVWRDEYLYAYIEVAWWISSPRCDVCMNVCEWMNVRCGLKYIQPYCYCNACLRPWLHVTRIYIYFFSYFGCFLHDGL